MADAETPATTGAYGRPAVDATLVAIAQQLATVAVKLDNLKDQVTEHRTVGVRQFDRVDTEIGRVKEEQRLLDKKVDTQGGDLLRQTEDIKRQVAQTQAMVEALQSPVHKWSTFENRIHGGWLVIAALIGVVSFILQPLLAHYWQHVLH